MRKQDGQRIKTQASWKSIVQTVSTSAGLLGFGPMMQLSWQRLAKIAVTLDG
jgi:hypothetical protein